LHRLPSRSRPSQNRTRPRPATHSRLAGRVGKPSHRTLHRGRAHPTSRSEDRWAHRSERPNPVHSSRPPRLTTWYRAMKISRDRVNHARIQAWSDPSEVNLSASVNRSLNPPPPYPRLRITTATTFNRNGPIQTDPARLLPPNLSTSPKSPSAPGCRFLLARTTRRKNSPPSTTSNLSGNLVPFALSFLPLGRLALITDRLNLVLFSLLFFQSPCLPSF